MKTDASLISATGAREGEPQAAVLAADESSTSKLVSLSIKNFAHLQSVNLDFGDLTVLVGPHGTGKSLALQWLKLGLDGRQIVQVLKQSGYITDKPDVLIEHILGRGWGQLGKPIQKFYSAVQPLLQSPLKGLGMEPSDCFLSQRIERS